MVEKIVYLIIDNSSSASFHANLYQIFTAAVVSPDDHECSCYHNKLMQSVSHYMCVMLMLTKCKLCDELLRCDYISHYHARPSPMSLRCDGARKLLL